MTGLPLKFASLLLIGLCSAAAADPSLLPNGDFSSAQQVAGWTSTASSSNIITWSTDDADGDPTSGSLALSAGESVGINAMALALSPCFRVTPGARYAFGGQSRRASDDAFGMLQCRAFSDNVCTMAVGPLGFAPLPQTSAWVAPASTSGTLPASAQSAYCSLTLSGSGSSLSPGTLHFDNLFFNSAAPAVSVRLQKFKVD